MISVDLDELPSIARRIWGLSHNRFNLFSIDDSDHVMLGHPGGIRENLIAWLSNQGFRCPQNTRIRLVTFPRVLGYGFNPVSFYFISSHSGEVIATVAEVVNTYREMKLYLVNHRNIEGRWHGRMAKNFYVSPFSDPGDEFDFTIGIPDAEWQVNIDNYSKGERILLSAIRGDQRVLNSARLVGYAFKYPLLSLKIIGLIHWHAFLLWAKRVPFFRKSARSEMQRDVMRPHSSLHKK